MFFIYKGIYEFRVELSMKRLPTRKSLVGCDCTKGPCVRSASGSEPRPRLGRSLPPGRPRALRAAWSAQSMEAVEALADMAVRGSLDGPD